MKKSLLTLACTAACFSFAYVCAETSTKLETVVFDAGRLLQESTEGKMFAESVNKKIVAFQTFAKTSYEKLSAEQKELETKRKALSQEAYQEKAEKITQSKKDLDRTLEDKKSLIEKDIEREKGKLGQKFMEIAKTLFDKEGWGLLLERNMPGVVCVADNKDVTGKLVLAVNTEYTKNNDAKKQTAKKIASA